MIGIIPAAGKATRMGGIPKFLLPAPGCISLLDRLRLLMLATNSPTRAVDRVIVLGNPQNIEIIEQNVSSDVRLATVMTRTMSQTVIAAHHIYEVDPIILFGMPDAYIADDYAFIKLCDTLGQGADVAVGVFQTRPEQRSKLGMCRVEGFKVTEVIDKPAETDLIWAWGVLAWKPVFWQHIHADEPHIGYALPRAIAAGLDVRAVTMDGGYWDAGTPSEYFALIRHLTDEKVTA